MNREDILQMGRQAGAFIELAQEKDLLWLERFAALVASAAQAKEREACAYRAGIAMLGADRGLANRVDQAIRARGQA